MRGKNHIWAEKTIPLRLASRRLISSEGVAANHDCISGIGFFSVAETFDTKSLMVETPRQPEKHRKPRGIPQI